MYRHPRRRRWLLPRRVITPLLVSPVERQHRHLAAGGQLGHDLVEATAQHFRELIQAGLIPQIEREIRPGTHFAVQIQALTELGTTEAVYLLDRLLSRSLTSDPVEQSWYWVDLAAGLRRLGATESLPSVLKCMQAAIELPAGVLLAAEAVAFPNFSSLLATPSTKSAQLAMAALALVARGCRLGTIEPGCMISAGLGELLNAVTECVPPTPNAWFCTAVLEAERLSKRLEHWRAFFSSTEAHQAELQSKRLNAVRLRRHQWLHTAKDQLLTCFSDASDDEQRNVLRFLYDLRAETADLFPVLPNYRISCWCEAIRCLTWSRSRRIGSMLTLQAQTWLKSSSHRGHLTLLLAALRGHPSPSAESVLLAGTTSTRPEVRRSALSSLGWWDPYSPEAVISRLRQCHLDADPQTRQAAVAALARLGDRTAFEELRSGLSSEEASIRTATARLIAQEELSWLWPDLECMTSCDDPIVAWTAYEALEQLREHLLGPLA
jgi:hypothetical protein